ncbi:helix-turn-helix domain-containing protein [Dyadobacter sp. Leaf189]|uniref:helix-turn-helix domain-containing protein n=1 Tax=Dyadobacter sp. Leaf189 TaxID=1736295 RepID=UPI0006FFD0F8|nr:helix-turn-helix domain-containing protein [Dyadobacter sp. Leaf189]KQS33319.1 AraC family transcriptional regulator [Dyadobacter sp. Leaf189]
MHYYTILPPPDLAAYIRCFWVLEHEVSACKPYFHKTMADGCAELIFHYQGRFDEIAQSGKTALSFTSGLSGPSSQFRRFCIGESFGIFGVYLFPFALPGLFKIPACELVNEMPDLQTLLGKKGEELEEQMMLAENNEVRVAIMCRFLRRCLLKSAQPEPAAFAMINQVIQNNGLTSVAGLAAQNNLSIRQLERKFKTFSGFSPKLFSRIVRFHTAMNAYGDRNKSLTEIAYEAGYYDQSHFIHEFKAFSGEHPGSYFSGNSEATEYRDV